MNTGQRVKRSVQFADDTDESKRSRLTTTTNDKRLHSGKHTLESDEEDDDEEQANGKKLDERDFVEMGRENATIDFDDEVKITPFNVDEELEAGDYDETGCFQWKKKDKDEIRDAWLDEIDWTNVKNYKLNNPASTSKQESNDDNNSNDDDDDKDVQFNELKTLKAMLVIMQPGETVTRTIKRLGTLASSNNKSKQAKKPRKLLPGEVAPEAVPEQTPEEIKKNKLLLDEMSGLADQFVSNGESDIYQETYERLRSKIDRLQSSAITTDSSFDMYGESDISASITKSKDNNNLTANVLWEYTNDENDKDNFQGPFTTEQMIRLNETEGKLDKDKVRCRRVGTEQFYSIKRIDFDLYLD